MPTLASRRPYEARPNGGPLIVPPYAVRYDSCHGMLQTEAFTDLEEALRFYATLLRSPDYFTIQLVDFREQLLKAYHAAP